VAPARMVDDGDVQLSEMTADEVAAWLPGSTARYIEDRVAAGEDRATAARVAEVQRALTFPGGVPAAGHRLMHVLAGGLPVGVVWVGPPALGGASTVFLYQIEINELHRGRGHGRAAMVATERFARTLGASRLMLNVFGFNTVARSLYDSLGFVEASAYLEKPLGSAVEPDEVHDVPLASP